MPRTSPEILVTHDPDLPRRSLRELSEGLSRISGRVRVEARKPGIYAAWEWLLPATIIIFLTNSVVGGFLQELGAGGARALKSAIARAFGRAKRRKQCWVNPDGSVSSPRVPLAIEVHTEGRGYIRLVLPCDLDSERVLRALELLPNAYVKAAEAREAHAQLRDLASPLDEFPERGTSHCSDTITRARPIRHLCVRTEHGTLARCKT
jgi:hypothetical protein